MANNIELKRSGVPGKIPTTSSLELGQLALNTYDGKLYMKKKDNVSESIIEIGGGGTGSAGISAIYIADEGVLQGTASYFDFIGPGVTATVSNDTASILIIGGGGGGTSGIAIHTQSFAATTWTFNHYLNEKYVVFDVYDSYSNAIIPANVSASSTSSLIINFAVPTAGWAVATAGSIQGIQGIQGTQGIQGIQGVIGTQGVQGIQGTQGLQGIQGIQGTQGTQGIQGSQGTQGIQGSQGDRKSVV